MEHGFKSVVEWYCPTVGHNVAVEITKKAQTHCVCCLNNQVCSQKSEKCSADRLSHKVGY